MKKILYIFLLYCPIVLSQPSSFLKVSKDVSINLVLEGHSFLSTNTSTYQTIISSQVNVKSIYNSAISGSYIAGPISRATTVDSKLVTETSTLRNIMILWIGTNDIKNGGISTSVYPNIKSYVQARLAVGWKVFVYTVTPATTPNVGTDFTNQRNILNNLYKTDLALLPNCYILDANSISQLADSSNTTYYSDGLHPTLAGHLLTSSLMVNRLQQIFALPNNNFTANTTLTLTSTGTGAGVSTMSLRVTESTLLTLDGNGYFYYDAAGTTGARQSYLLVPGRLQTLYLKCTSGVSNLKIEKNKIQSITNWVSSTNAVTLGGNMSPLNALDTITLVGNQALTCNLTGWTNLLYLYMTGSGNAVSGDGSGNTGITFINLNSSLLTATWNLSLCPNLVSITATGTNTFYGNPGKSSVLTYALIYGNNTCSGSETYCTNITTVDIQGNNTLNWNLGLLTKATSITFTGSNTTFGNIGLCVLAKRISLAGNTTISGDISTITPLEFYSVTGNSSVTFSTVANLHSLCALYVHTNIVLTSSNVNQILADFVANKDYAKPITNRTINIFAGTGTGAPTDQGIIDKAFLQSYKSPNNTGPTVWTVTTR